jgi:hypothetical protein
VPTAAHITKCALASAMGATARRARDAGDRAAGAPGLGGGVVASAVLCSVGLASVFAKLSVDALYKVCA